MRRRQAWEKQEKRKWLVDCKSWYGVHVIGTSPEDALNVSLEAIRSRHTQAGQSWEQKAEIVGAAKQACAISSYLPVCMFV